MSEVKQKCDLGTDHCECWKNGGACCHCPVEKCEPIPSPDSVKSIMKEIDSHFNDGFIGTAVSRAKKVSLLLQRVQALLSTHCVIDKETAKIINIATTEMRHGCGCFNTSKESKAFKVVESELSRITKEPIDDCEHEWVCGDNEKVSGAEVCVKCKAWRVKEPKQ